MSIFDEFDNEEDLAEALKGDFGRSICALFTRRIESSQDEALLNYELGEMDAPGWRSMEAISTEIKEDFLQKAERVAPDLDVLMSFIKPRLEQHVAWAIGEIKNSVEYGALNYSRSKFTLRIGEAPCSDTVTVGVSMEAHSFQVGINDLGFDLADRDQRVAYVQIAQRLCPDLRDFDCIYESDGCHWQSGMRRSQPPAELFVCVNDGVGVHEMIEEWRFQALEANVESDPDPVIKWFKYEIARIDDEASRRLIKAKLPKSALVSYAVAFLQASTSTHELMAPKQVSEDERLVFIRQALGLFGYDGSRADVLLEISRATLEKIGITEGKWWSRAPWRLLNLPVEELAFEGTMLRHCVGRFDMGYREAVAEGEMEIWSLRDRLNRPRLTWEIDFEALPTGPTVYGPEDLTGEGFKRQGLRVVQLRGFSNRFAGESDDEQRILEFIFDEFGIDPEEVEDYRPRAQNPQTNSNW